MTVEVREYERGVEVIKGFLAQVGIAETHYEVAVNRTADGNYESVWLPPGRSSLLHGASETQVIDEVSKRIEQLEAFRAKQNDLLASASAAFFSSLSRLEQSIAEVLRYTRPGLEGNAETFSAIQGLRATVRRNIENDAPSTALNIAWRDACGEYLASEYHDIALEIVALQRFHAAVKQIIQQFSPPQG